MQPVQFVVRKTVQLLNGDWVWRKGGTQKKDGFWALVRKHVSRRAVPSANLAVLHEMVTSAMAQDARVLQDMARLQP